MLQNTFFESDKCLTCWLKPSFCHECKNPKPLTLSIPQFGLNYDEKETRAKNAIPIWKKPFLTIIEAAEYFNIGRNKLVELVGDSENFVLRNGNKRLIKRKNLEEYLNEEYSI